MQNMCNGMGSLQVKSEQEALFLACEMERRAVRMYERGLMLCQDPAMMALLQKFRDDEKTHLNRFSQMGSAAPESRDQEQQILLKSYAAQILFPGGLMQAQREGALQDIRSLLHFARDSEETAVKSYQEFSASCESAEAKEAFIAIAAEEKTHLHDIQRQLDTYK